MPRRDSGRRHHRGGGPRKNSGLTISGRYIILSAYIGICEDGKQYPVCESQERTRLVEAFMQRPAKSSRSIGLNHK